MICGRNPIAMAKWGMFVIRGARCPSLMPGRTGSAGRGLRGSVGVSIRLHTDAYLMVTGGSRWCRG